MAPLKARFTCFLGTYPLRVASELQARLHRTVFVAWLHLCGGRILDLRLKFEFIPNSRGHAAEIFIMLSLQFLLLLGRSGNTAICDISGGPDLEVPLTDEIIYRVLRDLTLERLSMVSRSFSSMHRLITDVKILDPKGNELAKPPFFYGDAIVYDAVTVITEECRLL